jgi:SOS-response transcriptional repressor LexA
MINHEIGGSVHGPSYAMIANYPQVGFCDISDCDNRRPLVHGRMNAEDIKAELRSRNMSQRDLAEAVGMSENHLSKSLAGKRLFRLAEMDAIRAELAPEPDAFTIRTIPLLGSVPAGKFRPEEQRGGRRIPVSDPSTPPNAYALEVDGDSMDLIVPHGTTIVIDPDDRALWPGRRYIIQTEDGQTTFKEFQADPARLVPCSSNPAHKEIPLGGDPVTVVGRVYSYTLRDGDLPRRTA